MTIPNLQKRATNAAWWSTLEIVARYGVQFIVMVVLARILAPEDFGLLAMLMIFTAVGAILVDSGFGLALIQRQETTADEETTVFIFSLGMSFCIAGALWLLAPEIARFYARPELLALLRVILLVLPLGALGAVPDALLTMRLNFKARTGAEIVASLISGVVAIVLALKGFGVWSLVWQAIVAAALRAFMLLSFARWVPRGRFTLRSFSRLFAFGGYMLLSSLLDMASTQLQPLLIGRLFSARALGFYTLAQNTQQAPASVIGRILNRVGLPVLASVAHDRERLRNGLQYTLRISMFLFVPCMFGLALVADRLVIAVYGAQWAAAAPVLSILAISTSLWPMHVLNLAAISAQGRSDLLFKLTLVKSVASVILIVALSPGGLLAIAFGVLASSIFSVVVNAHYSKKLLQYGLWPQIYDQRGTAALSILAAIAGWIPLQLVAGISGMAIAIAAAVLVYAGGAWVSGQQAFFEMLALLHSVRGGSAEGASAVGGG